MKENFLENHTEKEERLERDCQPSEELLRSRRPRSNIPHFIALQNAFSNLARIDDFDLEELGYGFFSDVFKVTHKLTGQVMVLKRNKNTNTKMNILRELQLMNRLCHPNILKLMGACVHQGQMHALTEYINGGDLDQLILNKDVYLSWSTRVEISLQIALGMEYLHSFGVFHRDLSAKNCLIRVSESTTDSDKIYGAVVADFGLAEKIPTCSEERNSLQIVGTPYVIAPEVLREKPYDQTADVFSFGILLCQLIARLPCDPEELPRTNDFGLNVELYKSILLDNKAQPPETFLQLAIDCCQVDATIRPSFSQIVSRLQNIRNDARNQDVQMLSNQGDTNKSNHGDDLSAFISIEDPSHLDNAAFENDPSEHSTQVTVVKLRKGSTKRNSSSSRLSKSFSDISWELINHAANMANANDQQQIGNSNSSDGQSSFTNPFAALEYLNGQMDQKLVDVPSQTFLEMTFNLGYDQQFGNNEERRPVSRYSLYGDEMTFSPNEFLTMHNLRDGICSHPSSFQHKRAIHRAMVLSPSGGGLDLWWRAHRSSTSCDDEVDTTGGCSAGERHSLAKVISALSRNSRHMRRRCISMPNLERLRVLFENESLSFGKSNEAKQTSKPDDLCENVFTYNSGTTQKSDYNNRHVETKSHKKLERTVSERSPVSPMYVRSFDDTPTFHSHTPITSVKYSHKTDRVCTNCCCTVKVSPTSFKDASLINKPDETAATLFTTDRPSWRSCICGISIPLIDYQDST